MNKKQVILKVDSRDRHAHVRFGYVSTFSAESNFGFDLFQVVEPETAISCTEYSLTKIRSSQTKIQYDIDEAWAKVSHGVEGADPKDTIKSAVTNGLKYLNATTRDFGLKGYYRCDTGSLSDQFENTRSAMTLGESSAMANTYWYREWNDTPVFGVLPEGKTVVGAHSYVIVDWKVIDGETVFLIDSHQGQKRYMPRTVFNKAISTLGCSALLPCDQAVLDVRNKTIWEAISDIIKNLWIAVRGLQIKVNELPVKKNDYEEVKQAITMNKIETWAKAIAKWEGDTSGTNPGNLKYATLTASWGAVRGRKGGDGGYFAKFGSYQEGFDALCKFLTLGCRNQLKSYHNARTFEAFTKIYAGNPPHGYIEGIRAIVGCELNTDISTFL